MERATTEEGIGDAAIVESGTMALGPPGLSNARADAVAFARRTARRHRDVLSWQRSRKKTIMNATHW